MLWILLEVVGISMVAYGLLKLGIFIGGVIFTTALGILFIAAAAVVMFYILFIYWGKFYEKEWDSKYKPFCKIQGGLYFFTTSNKIHKNRRIYKVIMR